MVGASAVTFASQPPLSPRGRPRAGVAAPGNLSQTGSNGRDDRRIQERAREECVAAIVWPVSALIALAVHAGVDGFAVALVGIEAVPTIVIGVSSARAASRAVARIPYVAEGLATGDLTRSTGITLPGETGLFAAANADVAAGSQATSEHAGYVAAGAERMSAAIREIAATADQAAKVAETGRDGQSVNPSADRPGRGA